MLLQCGRMMIISTIALSSEFALGQGVLPPSYDHAISDFGRVGVTGDVKGDSALPSEDVLDLEGEGMPRAAAYKSLQQVRPDGRRTNRGTKEAQIYQRVSPSVVLIINKDSLGSGALLTAQGDILTNWHVVKGAGQVGVIFKPIVEGQAPVAKDIRRATVYKVDEVADLALIRVGDVPGGHLPVQLGSAIDLQVGADVHAIGHPTGESWTYTKGVVSQVRLNYEWSSDETRKMHRANVVQTQTPINPGNSGGPLLNDQGVLVGVNSFKAKGEGLNFAIAVDEVRRFLNAPTSRLADSYVPVSQRNASGSCKVGELYRGQNQERTGDVVGFDTDCDGRVDYEVRTPYDSTKAITAAFDLNKDSRPDILVFDPSRTGRWELSLHDVDFDGKWDLVGFHPDGKLVPSRFELYSKYAAR